MNSARRNKNQSNRRNDTRSNEQIELGTLLHIVEKQPVLQLTCQDIPYPNSPVVLNNKVVGKVDEVLGTLEKAYASVTMDADIKLEKGTVFYGYKDKFIFKKRFLPREDVEKKKEENDKKYEKGKGQGVSGKKYGSKEGSERKGYGKGYSENGRNKRGYGDTRKDNKRYKK